jgi:hypothetical protein
MVYKELNMRKGLILLIVFISFSLPCFSQEVKNNFIVFPIRNNIFMWSFPNYWIGDADFANKINHAAFFRLSGYTNENSIAFFCINFGDDVSTITLENYAIKDTNRFRRTMGGDYIAEKIEWDINRQDDVKIIVYKLYSMQRTMYQYCAFMQNTMKNYIISFIQLNIEHDVNEVLINDFKKFLEGVTATEGTINN